MHHKRTPLIMLSLLISSPAIQPIQASTVPEIHQSLDTLENGTDLIVARKTCSSKGDTTLDTVYRSEMIRELIDSYKSSDYVFIATAVFSLAYGKISLKTDDTQSDQINAGSDTIFSLTDSVIIQIDTV